MYHALQTEHLCPEVEAARGIRMSGDLGGSTLTGTWEPPPPRTPDTGRPTMPGVIGGEPMAYVRVTMADKTVLEAGTALDDSTEALSACAVIVKDLWREVSIEEGEQ